jgi:uncharacterized protein YutE (UPF0331/DUF86 family)
MAGLDRQLLAEKAAAVERHLRRVSERLPAEPERLAPNTDASDAVILHLWQAVQLVIDLALSANLHLDLGTPENYGDAFARLRDSGHLDDDLTRRLVRAAGFRNQVAHAYEKLDMTRVHEAAERGPEDLRAFLSVLETLVD